LHAEDRERKSHPKVLKDTRRHKSTRSVSNRGLSIRSSNRFQVVYQDDQIFSRSRPVGRCLSTGGRRSEKFQPEGNQCSRKKRSRQIQGKGMHFRTAFLVLSDTGIAKQHFIFMLINSSDVFRSSFLFYLGVAFCHKLNNRAGTSIVFARDNIAALVSFFFLLSSRCSFGCCCALFVSG